MMARPARESDVGDTSFNNSVVEEVSAACSRARRAS